MSRANWDRGDEEGRENDLMFNTKLAKLSLATLESGSSSVFGRNNGEVSHLQNLLRIGSLA